MTPQNTTQPGIISVDEAVELIKSDTREDPVVDMDYMVEKLVWLETAHNFRIPKIKRLPKEKITRSPRGKIIEFEQLGSVWVTVGTAFEKELLKKTILDKYRELVGHEYQAKNTRAVSTVADDAQGRDAVKPRKNRPIAQEGQSIGEGATVTTNGENLTV